MSGVEEKERYFVLSFDEYIEDYEDYIVTFRGIRATSLDEAIKIAQKWCSDICDEYADENKLRIIRVYDIEDIPKYGGRFLINPR